MVSAAISDAAEPEQRSKSPTALCQPHHDPPRMAELERCIAVAAGADDPAGKIFVCIRQRYRRFETPDHCHSTSRASATASNIVRSAEDYGPGTKLLGSIDHVPRGKDALLVLVEDDVIYRPHMLETAGTNFAASPGTAASCTPTATAGCSVGQAPTVSRCPWTGWTACAPIVAKSGHAPKRSSSTTSGSPILWLQGIRIADLSAMDRSAGLHLPDDPQRRRQP